MSSLLTRRRFFSALAASVVAVGAPLPVGFPKTATKPFNPSNLQWTVYERFMALENSLMYGIHDEIVLQLSTN